MVEVAINHFEILQPPPYNCLLHCPSETRSRGGRISVLVAFRVRGVKNQSDKQKIYPQNFICSKQ